MKTVGIRVNDQLNNILSNGNDEMKALAICNKVFNCDVAYLNGAQLKKVLDAGMRPVIIDVVL